MEKINKKEINRTLDFIENIIKDIKPFPQDRQGMTLIEKEQTPEGAEPEEYELHKIQDQGAVAFKKALQARIRKERKMLDEGYVHESFMG